MRRRMIVGAGAGALFTPALVRAQPAPAPAQAPAAEERLRLELKDGSVTIRFLPDVAPRHVERIKALTRQGFYNNTPFHRVIEGFMAQGGDPTGTGTGGSPLPNLAAEFTNRYNFERGTCGMARAQDPNSANSQFFIMFAPNANLNGQYTIWGRVIAGLDAVDKIKRGAPGSGTVTNPDRIVRASLVTA